MTTRAGLILCALALTTAPAAAEDAPHTVAAVVAADQAWGDAEVNGNAAFIETLLLPGYRSIDVDGKVKDKEALLASVKKRGARSEKFAAQVAAWKASHATRADVKIYGDTAVLTWLIVTPGNVEVISSCDIFVYQDGAWHAVYSQHSNASG